MKKSDIQWNSKYEFTTRDGRSRFGQVIEIYDYAVEVAILHKTYIDKVYFFVKNEVFRFVDLKISAVIEVSPPVEKKELKELKDFFSTCKVKSIRLDEITTIKDVPKFVDGHISMAEAHMGNNNINFRSYMQRLRMAKLLIENG